jgi:hypothetical protein
MALSFVYLAFTRILQLVRLSRQDRDELAIEVVMLRHEVAVLRRKSSDRPCVTQIAPCWLGWAGCWTIGIEAGSSCNPRPCSAGTET